MMPKTIRKSEPEIIKDVKKSRKSNEGVPLLPQINAKDVCKNVMEFEEKEAEVRSGMEDLELFKQITAEIKKKMEEILNLKLKSKMDEKTKNEINEKRIQASLLFVTLKKLNRLDKLRLKRARDMTHDAKQRVDTFHLQLENLQYEVFHLRKEVDKCLEFKSKDEDIDLVPVDEFYKDAPPSISKQDATRLDTHKLTLARLEWEFEQRKRLSEQCRNLELSRERVANEIANKQKHLENLVPRLNAILEATRPLQEELNLPLEQYKFQKELAALLPDPLYILYSQMKAYAEACDSSMQVTIQGEMADARDFGSKVKKGLDDILEDVDSDSDLDNDYEVDRRATTTVEKKLDSISAKHPLMVQLNVENVLITFSYLVSLNIVMVKATTSAKEDSACLLPMDNLLSALFADDYGDESPNLSNAYQSSSISQTQMLEAGKSYLWAQRLSGLDFSSMTKTTPRSFVNSDYVDQVVRAIKNRISNRIQLNKILSCLESGNMPHVAGSGSTPLPQSASSRLMTWMSTNYEECRKTKHFESLMSFMAINPKNVQLFKVVFQRETAKLNAFVIVPMDYPNSAPLFALELDWHGKYTRGNSEDIRRMEAEVNVFHEELSPGNKIDLIAEQLKRLTLALDLITEVDGQLLMRGRGSKQTLLNPEFPAEKMVPQLVKGHDRAKPFLYDQKTAFFLHR